MSSAYLGKSIQSSISQTARLLGALLVYFDLLNLIYGRVAV